MSNRTVDIHKDRDGARVILSNRNGTAIFRVDNSTGQGRMTVYREDQKPTKRRHWLVEGDSASAWAMGHLDLLERATGQ